MYNLLNRSMLKEKELHSFSFDDELITSDSGGLIDVVDENIYYRNSNTRYIPKSPRLVLSLVIIYICFVSYTLSFCYSFNSI